MIGLGAAPLDKQVLQEDQKRSRMQANYSQQAWGQAMAPKPQPMQQPTQQPMQQPGMQQRGFQQRMAQQRMTKLNPSTSARQKLANMASAYGWQRIGI